MKLGDHAYPEARDDLADLVTLRSASAARAACQPGIPQTPPPAWVAELP